jgi:hypothetical protein
MSGPSLSSPEGEKFLKEEKGEFSQRREIEAGGRKELMSCCCA